MFRKLSHILIVLLLLTTTVGFSISKHYCEARLVSTNINHQEKPCCNMADCCHNETKLYQLNNDFFSSPVLNSNIIFLTDLLFPAFYVMLKDFSSEEIISVYRIHESPPPLKIQTILSLNQTYIC